MADTVGTTGIAARAREVWKVYGAGEARVVALRSVSVELRRGQFTAIMGPSGSGKSTLMHCLAGLDTVTRGEVQIGDTALGGLSDAKLTRLRRDQVGFVFQQFNLLPTLTAAENILLPLAIAGRKPDRDWYTTVIDAVNLADRRDFGQTIVMVTHDPNAASYADRVIFLADGQVVAELAEPTAETVLDRMKQLDSAVIDTAAVMS